MSSMRRAREELEGTGAGAASMPSPLQQEFSEGNE